MNERTLQATKKTLAAGSLAVRADVSNLPDLDMMFSTIKREFGHLDGVFVNAGYSEFLLFEHVTEQSFDKVIAVNFSVAHLAQALISAERGDFERVETLARDAEAASIPTGASRILAMGQFVRGRAAVAHQRYAVGLGYLRRALDGSDPAHHPFVGAWCFSDLIEAALHCDQLDTARTYLSQLESLATSTSGPLIYAELAYARGDCRRY